MGAFTKRRKKKDTTPQVKSAPSIVDPLKVHQTALPTVPQYQAPKSTSISSYLIQEEQRKDFSASENFWFKLRLQTGLSKADYIYLQNLSDDSKTKGRVTTVEEEIPLQLDADKLLNEFWANTVYWVLVKELKIHTNTNWVSHIADAGYAPDKGLLFLAEVGSDTWKGWKTGGPPGAILGFVVSVAKHVIDDVTTSLERDERRKALNRLLTPYWEGALKVAGTPPARMFHALVGTSIDTGSIYDAVSLTEAFMYWYGKASSTFDGKTGLGTAQSIQKAIATVKGNNPYPSDNRMRLVFDGKWPAEPKIDSAIRTRLLIEALGNWGANFATSSFYTRSYDSAGDGPERNKMLELRREINADELVFASSTGQKITIDLGPNSWAMPTRVRTA